jgi:hypothetical protein
MRGDQEAGLALGITHLVAVGVLLAALAAPHGSGWSDILPFSLLTFLDLPLSLIPIFLPQLELKPEAGISGFLGRVIIDGVVGTACYYYLPRLVKRLRWNC